MRNFKRIGGGVLALLVGLLAAAGCMPAPLPRGIYCLSNDAGSLQAFQLVNQTQNLGGTTEEWKGYRSTDGGLTWSTAADLDAKAAASHGCHDTLPHNGTYNSTWVLDAAHYRENADPKAIYLFLVDQGIYRSEDGGTSYRKDTAWPGYVQDATFSPATGNLVLALGKPQVRVRTADGKWLDVQVAQ